MQYGFRGTMENTDDLAALLGWIKSKAGEEIKFMALPEMERGEYIVDEDFQVIVVSEEVYEKLSYYTVCRMFGIESDRFVDVEVN